MARICRTRHLKPGTVRNGKTILGWVKQFRAPNGETCSVYKMQCDNCLVIYSAPLNASTCVKCKPHTKKANPEKMQLTITPPQPITIEVKPELLGKVRDERVEKYWRERLVIINEIEQYRRDISNIENYIHNLEEHLVELK